MGRGSVRMMMMMMVKDRVMECVIRVRINVLRVQCCVDKIVCGL